MSQSNIPFGRNIGNSLYTKEKCPKCRSIYIAGFEQNGNRCCPLCGYNYFKNINNNSISNNGCNNIHYFDGCPAIMSDGRFITYFPSSRELTDTMMKIYDIKDPNDFRKFMQKNADQLMNRERYYLLKNNICHPTIGCSQGWNSLWSKLNNNFLYH